MDTLGHDPAGVTGDRLRRGATWALASGVAALVLYLARVLLRDGLRLMPGAVRT